MSVLTMIPGGIERLLAVSPLELGAYLGSTGWVLSEADDVRSFWLAKNRDGEEFEVLVPSAPSFKDYAVRVNEALATLQVFEERPYSAVLGDVEDYSSDIIRVRASGRDSRGGDIALAAGINLIKCAGDLVEAAACSALQAKPVHSNRKPEETSRYLKRARLGQTEPGSFIVRISSRVPPTLDIQEDLLPIGENKAVTEPFERRVTETLAGSLGALTELVKVRHPTAQLTTSSSIVKKGVSANLCEALVGMEEDDQKISVRLTWARSRPVQTSYPSEFSFAPGSLPVLAEVARHFRASAPDLGYELVGYVVKLAKTPKARRGTIGVFVVVDGHPKVISVRLEEYEYRQAVRAHRDKLIVSCSGELVKEGHGLTLKNYRNFAVVEEAAK